MAEQTKDPKIRLARELQAFCENLEWAANAHPGMPSDYRTIRQDMSLLLLKPLELLLSVHPAATTDWTPASLLTDSRFSKSRPHIDFLRSKNSIGDILNPQELTQAGDLKGNLEALQTYLKNDNALFTNDPQDRHYHKQYRALTALLERANETEGFWPWVEQRLTGVSASPAR